MRRIPKDSWAIIEKVLRRYQDNKTEYENLIDELMERSPVQDGQPHGTSIVRPTELTAIQLVSASPKTARLKREINAVEAVYNQLRPEEQEVIRLRFFSSRSKNTPYWRLAAKCSYSERQMKRIISKTVSKVGEYLGEI